MRGNKYWEALEIAQDILKDKNYTLDLISKETGIPLQTIKFYSSKTDKLQDVKFSRIMKLVDFSEKYKKQYKMY